MMQIIREGWDLVQNEIPVMQWLNSLLDSDSLAPVVDIQIRFEGGVPRLLYDIMGILVLLPGSIFLVKDTRSGCLTRHTKWSSLIFLILINLSALALFMSLSKEKTAVDFVIVGVFLVSTGASWIKKRFMVKKWRSVPDCCSEIRDDAVDCHVFGYKKETCERPIKRALAKAFLRAAFGLREGGCACGGYKRSGRARSKRKKF